MQNRERPAHVRSLAEAVLFAGQRNVGHANSSASERIENHLRLGWWHHFVLQALQHDQRPVEPVEVVNRRTLAITVASRGIRADQTVEVAADAPRVWRVNRSGGRPSFVPGRREAGEAQFLFDSVSGTGADYFPGQLATLEQTNGRDASGAVLSGHRLVGVDIDLHNLDTSTVLL